MTIASPKTSRENDGRPVLDEQLQVNETNKKSPGILSPSFIFAILLIPRLAAAQYSIIGDCDEVFNYWEPTHYLVHGSGFQTWEYSPLYAIRSWFYIAIHAIVIKSLVFLQFTKQFYGLRVVLGIASAFCETVLVHYVQLYQCPSIGIDLLVTLFASAGMFVASAAYLPSTFAMYGVTLAHALSLQPPSKSRTIQVFSTIGIAAILSWPFAIVLVAVLAIQELAQLEWNRRRISDLGKAVFLSILLVLLVLSVVVAVDSAAYRRLQVVPFNIILYNVFSSKDRGPNIFGTEPWWYYVVNLILYFNVVSIAAWCSLPLLILGLVFQTNKRWLVVRNNLTLLSIYLWIGIFIVQPHKEERFMYVIYPLLCYNAVHAIDFLKQLFESLSLRHIHPSTTRILFRAFKFTVMVVYVIFSLARMLAQLRAFAAPMQVYGKEWYRFPSSFFVPENSQALFVKSAFDGLLPGRFVESEDLGWRSGIWRIPRGMNDRNLEDISHLVPVESCDYVVDSDFPSRDDGDDGNGNQLEPRYSIMSNIWSKVLCKPFLDAANSGLFGRAVWLPFFPLDSSSWGEYCLLNRSQKNV